MIRVNRAILLAHFGLEAEGSWSLRESGKTSYLAVCCDAFLWVGSAISQRKGLSGSALDLDRLVEVPNARFASTVAAIAFSYTVGVLKVSGGCAESFF